MRDTHRTVGLVVLLGAASATMFACGRLAGDEPLSSSNAAAVSDAGGDEANLVDGGAADAVAVAAFPGDAQQVVGTRLGPWAAPGSACNGMPDTAYTFTFPAHELSWSICVEGDDASFDVHAGKKTLSDSESAPIIAALHALTVTTQSEECEQDGDGSRLTVTTPHGDEVLDDDVYFCHGQLPRTYVHGMDDVFAAFEEALK